MSTATITDNQQPHRIIAICPGCRARWKVLPQLTGKKASCVKCKTNFVVLAAPAQANPPQTALDSTKPVDNLFSKEQIGVATLLGSVLAGAIMIAMNFARLGRQAAAIGTLIAGIAGLGVLAAIGYIAAMNGIPAQSSFRCWLHSRRRQLRPRRSHRNMPRTKSTVSNRVATGLSPASH